MSNTPIQQFFKEHGISEVEAVVPDMAGIARGKVTLTSSAPVTAGRP